MVRKRLGANNQTSAHTLSERAQTPAHLVYIFCVQGSAARAGAHLCVATLCEKFKHIEAHWQPCAQCCRRTWAQSYTGMCVASVCVPVSKTLLLTGRELSALLVWFSLFFSRCASSQTKRSQQSLYLIKRPTWVRRHS